MEKEKDIFNMPCKFTLEQIVKKVKELYPDMDDLEARNHAEHIEYVDWLKVTEDDDELAKVVREQVENP